MSRIKQASPALVISIIALVAALVVPALAQVATTALSKKEKRVVRKIARSQINKLAPRLAVASAKSAGNADKVDGLDASAFTPAGEVHTPARFVRNDSTPGDGNQQVSDLIAVGPFIFRGYCGDEPVSDAATIYVLAPAGSSFSGPLSDGGNVNLETTGAAAVTHVFASGNEVVAGHVIIAAPNGQVLNVSASAEVGDPAGDCIFGVTAIGS